jgi:ribosomal protein S18 acetylase RimI-like enzyme
MYSIERVVLDDREEVVKVTKDIWDGDDYIPQYFDQWVGDSSGEFVKALYNGSIVGLGKLTMVSERDSWIEGLRKDPQFDGRGVGTAIMNYFLDRLTKDSLIDSIRLSTYIHNLEALAIFEKLGFEKIDTRSYKYLQLDREERYTIDPHIDITPDFDEVLNYLRSSNYLRSIEKGINRNWVVYPFSEDLIKSYLDDNQIGVFKVDNRVVGVVLWYNTIDSCSISIIDGDLSVMKELVKVVYNMMIERGFNYLSIFQTLDENVKRFIVEEGFKSWEVEDDFLLFQYPK